MASSGNQNLSVEAAFRAFTIKWKNEEKENATRAYVLARQELNMLGGIRHPHVSVLVGFSHSPTTLIFELAPNSSLDNMLEKYK